MRAESRQAAFRVLGELPSGVRGLRSWHATRWAIAALAGSAGALIMGVPTGLVPTSLYSRMTPVVWWNYPVWGISALLLGLTAATYVQVAGADSRAPDHSKQTLGAAMLSTFAVGCPICNKLVVALVGVTGALNYWAPLQPILGVLSVVLLASGLLMRLRGSVACRAQVEL
jgi:hypothetical protein